jgi:hypothetical protein
MPLLMLARNVKLKDIACSYIKTTQVNNPTRGKVVETKLRI